MWVILTDQSTEKGHWYLNRYLEMSDELRRASELKESYRRWFQQTKEIGSEHITLVKEGLYEL